MTEAIGGHCKDCKSYDREERKCKETKEYVARKMTCENFK